MGWPASRALLTMRLLVSMTAGKPVMTGRNLS